MNASTIWAVLMLFGLASGVSGCFESGQVPAAKLSSQDAAFAALPAEKQNFVTATYQLAFDLYKKGEFEKASFEIAKLHQLLPAGYKDSLDIARYAQKA